ncbi:MFS transporter [Parageobacillus toebii]|uniref:MFS transporter n=1 Tax=Parageobacillus toebii TaxID=153151 RepID=UPI00359342B0
MFYRFKEVPKKFHKKAPRLEEDEAPVFQTNSCVVATWFPQQERAFATGVYTAGEYIGLSVSHPFLFWLLSSSGWHSVFIATGIIGLVWTVF